MLKCHRYWSIRKLSSSCIFFNTASTSTSAAPHNVLTAKGDTLALLNSNLNRSDLFGIGPHIDVSFFKLNIYNV